MMLMLEVSELMTRKSEPNNDCVGALLLVASTEAWSLGVNDVRGRRSCNPDLA